MKRSLPTAIGLAAALALFVLFKLQLLNGWSANSDHPYMGYDYFGWPRAALAILNGTNPFTAHLDYDYGPWATGFVTFPALAVAGIPLAWLPPWGGFWAVSILALALHLAIIAVFGTRLDAPRPRDCVFMAAMGLFLPWYVMYYMGQYHSLAVLAVFLVLAWGSTASQVAGFAISALAKPVLGPAALVLFLRREWKTVWIIVGVLAVTMLPWFVIRHDAAGFHPGLNPIMGEYTAEAALIAKYTAWRWNHQISLAAALDELLDPRANLMARYYLTVAILAAAALIALYRDRRAAICMALTWFFAFYARGHEYHYTLLVPVMLGLWSLPGGRYRTWWVVALAVAAAAPTTWVIFKYHYGIENSIRSCDLMLSHNAPLYELFLWHKPATALLLASTIAWTESRGPAAGEKLNPTPLRDTQDP